MSAKKVHTEVYPWERIRNARERVGQMASDRGQPCHPFPCTVANLISFLSELDPDTEIVTTYGTITGDGDCGFETAPLQLCSVDLQYVYPEAGSAGVIHLTGRGETTKWVGVCSSMVRDGWEPPSGEDSGTAP